MSWQSHHDILTGLPNRTALANRFEQEIVRAREDETLLAVCLFDLDHFQQVNQGMGQAAGDEILKQAASRLHDFAGQRHYAARLGGDEFVLLLPGLNQRADIEQTMRLLMEALSRDYVCDGEAVQMSASVGVSPWQNWPVDLWPARWPSREAIVSVVQCRRQAFSWLSRKSSSCSR